MLVRQVGSTLPTLQFPPALSKHLTYNSAQQCGIFIVYQASSHVLL